MRVFEPKNFLFKTNIFISLKIKKKLHEEVFLLIRLNLILSIVEKKNDGKNSERTYSISYEFNIFYKLNIELIK